MSIIEHLHLETVYVMKIADPCPGSHKHVMAKGRPVSLILVKSM